MINYKLTLLLSGEANSAVIRSDGACIPFDPQNTDYAEYLEWVAEGNTPEPMDVPNPQLAINVEALAYLDSTDWYVTRFAETGEAIPTDIKTKRQEARLAVIQID